MSHNGSYYGEDDYDDTYDYAPPTEIIPQEDTGEGDKSGEYDYMFDALISDVTRDYNPRALRSSDTTSVSGVDYVAAQRYDGLYNSFLDVSERAQDIIAGYDRAYRDAYSRNAELASLSDDLQQRLNQSSLAVRAAVNGTIIAQRESDEHALAVEKKNGVIKHTRIVLGALCTGLAIACIGLSFFSVSARGAASDAEVRANSSAARIAELEKQLETAANSAKTAAGDSKTLQSQIDVLTKRVDESDKENESLNKEIVAKNEEIAKLKQELDSSPATVTQTVPAPAPAPAPVSPPQDQSAPTATVTQTVRP